MKIQKLICKIFGHKVKPLIVITNMSVGNIDEKAVELMFDKTRCLRCEKKFYN